MTLEDVIKGYKQENEIDNMTINSEDKTKPFGDQKDLENLSNILNNNLNSVAKPVGDLSKLSKDELGNYINDLSDKTATSITDYAKSTVGNIDKITLDNFVKETTSRVLNGAQSKISDIVEGTYHITTEELNTSLELARNFATTKGASSNTLYSEHFNIGSYFANNLLSLYGGLNKFSDAYYNGVRTDFYWDLYITTQKEQPKFPFNGFVPALDFNISSEQVKNKEIDYGYNTFQLMEDKTFPTEISFSIYDDYYMQVEDWCREYIHTVLRGYDTISGYLSSEKPLDDLSVETFDKQYCLIDIFWLTSEATSVFKHRKYACIPILELDYDKGYMTKQASERKTLKFSIVGVSGLQNNIKSLKPTEVIDVIRKIM